MTDLFPARMQMAVSLDFHIIFSCIGMVMPFLMVASHRMWMKTKDPVYYDLTKAWSKGVAILCHYSKRPRRRLPSTYWPSH